jgi:hypothetical protein
MGNGKRVAKREGEEEASINKTSQKSHSSAHTPNQWQSAAKIISEVQ